jgi:hypothetical protein
MPNIINHTFQKDNNRAPNGMIGALQQQFEADLYGNMEGGDISLLPALLEFYQDTLKIIQLLKEGCEFKNEYLQRYEEFLLQAEMSVSKILDEKYLKNVAAQDVPTRPSKSGVAEKEKEFIRNPRKRS